MALVVKDRVRENSTTTGTGTLTLSGAVSGFQTFSSAIGNTNTTYYAIVMGTEWEVGLGTVGAGTLSRDTILESSNAGSAVNFSAGTKDVFCTYPAEKSVYYDGSGNVAISITGNAANITGTYGGTITSSQVTTGLGYTPVTDARTITINGTAYDLSANRTWSVGTLTSSDIGVSLQGYDADLQAIGALSGTSGLLKKTAANTWTLDTGTYVVGNTTTNFTAQQYFGTSTLTDAATISWSVGSAQVAKVTLGANRTFGAPTGMVDGGFYALLVIQDATGSRTLSWNSVFKWDSGTAPILSTAASAKDFFIFRSDGTNLYEQGRSLGVA